MIAHAALAPSRLAHLRQLEAESILIFRETAAFLHRLALLYSTGKDSCVLLHLARKAFHPDPPPLSLLHVSTTWDFREVIAHRDETAARFGLDLIVHRNDGALARGVNPFDTPVADYTRLLLTDPLREALQRYAFQAAFGGGRRDEDRARAKERIFSFRNERQAWEPRAQRPELWTLYNPRIRPGESVRVFPLSNWTEADIWDYVALERIPLVSLYFAAERPVVRRGRALVVVDDERMRLEPGEIPERRRVRFRTIGCYPLSGAAESDADTLDAVISEIHSSEYGERYGRLIEADPSATLEAKKKEGYF